MQLGQSRVVEIEIFGQECQRFGINLKLGDLAGLKMLCADKPQIDGYLKMNVNTYRRSTMVADTEFINYEKAIKLIVPVLTRNPDGKFSIGWTLCKSAKSKIDLINSGRHPPIPVPSIVKSDQQSE